MHPNLSSYFSEESYEEDLKLFYKKYFGHASMVKEDGDYAVEDNKAFMLINNGGVVKRISNVCRHRQAIIKEGCGNTKALTCHLHGWTYDNSGKIIAAPHMKPQQVCGKNLLDSEVKNVGGFLFDRHLGYPDDMFSKFGLNPETYQYHSSDSKEYDFNWKTFVEVYSEDYHVDAFHPGLSNTVSTSDLQWHNLSYSWGRSSYHVATAGWNPKSTSHNYNQWVSEVKRLFGDKMPTYGVVWFMIYPGIMIEFYPGCCVVADITPTGPESCKIVNRYFYTEEITLFEPDFIKWHKLAFNETTSEDDEICRRIHEGRKALWNTGGHDIGPYQEGMEDGLADFHKWYKVMQND